MKPEKRSFSIRGHRTSISLEAPFWDALKAAAAEDGRSLAALVAMIDAERGDANLSSAVRVWLLRRLTERRPAREGGGGAGERS